ncbi:MAG: Spy/CpxP family protein refolding chaperone [Myxococcota bacterium]
MSKFRRALLAATVAFFTATGFVACASDEGNDDDVSADEARRQQRDAFRAVVDASLEAADLTTAQREELDAIRERVRRDPAARARDRQAMREVVSDIVRDGTAQTERFETALERVAETIETRIAESRAAMVDVHELLAPEQRRAVADVLRARVDERWGKPRRERHQGFTGLMEDLALTPDQVAELERLRDRLMGQSKQLKPTAEEVYDLIDAFETDAFAPALDAFWSERAPLLRERLAQAGEQTDALLSVFEEDQRDLLADIIEEGTGVLKAPPVERVTASPAR